MLNVITVDEAKTLIEREFAESGSTEKLPLSEAAGRVAAADMISGIDVPSFSRSTMDGYALSSGDTLGCGETMPSMLDIKGEILMGEAAEMTLTGGDCAAISTGGMLPGGADAVVPVEKTEEDCGTCLVYGSVSPFENVIKAGDDLQKGTASVKKGTVLSPSRIGVLASSGEAAVEVKTKPAVGIISTGSEIIPLGEKLKPGRIYEVNSFVLDAFCRAQGCETRLYGTVKDDYDEISAVFARALSECDCVIISGGSSAGIRDMTVRAIGEKGRVLAHGLAMKPGKPTIIGECGGKAVFGLPGHPGACFFTAEIIVKKYIDVFLGRIERPVTGECELAENISSNHGREEYICVKVQNGTAWPLYAKSGLMSVIGAADGYIKIGRNLEGLKKGDRVTVFRF